MKESDKKQIEILSLYGMTGFVIAIFDAIIARYKSIYHVGGLYIEAHPYYGIGLIFIAIGIAIVIYGGYKGSVAYNNYGKGQKLKVIIKRGPKTVRCPICGYILDVSDKSEGTCPDCKNFIEIFYEG